MVVIIPGHCHLNGSAHLLGNWLANLDENRYILHRQVLKYSRNDKNMRQFISNHLAGHFVGALDRDLREIILLMLTS